MVDQLIGSSRQHRQVEELLQALLDTLPIYVARVDRDCRIRALSGRRLMRPPAEYVGLNASEMVPAHHRDRYRQSVTEAFDAGSASQMLVEFPQAQPRTLWLEIHFGPVMRDGAIAEVIVVGRDVTEHRDIEHRLEVGVRLGRLTIFEWSWPDDQLRPLVGDFDSIPSGATFSQFLERVHPHDREGLVEIARRMRDGLGSLEHEFRILVEDDNVRWIHAYGEARRNADGEFGGAIAASRDITEEKESELALRHSEALLSRTIEAASLILWEVDHRTGNISFTGATDCLGEVPTNIAPWRRRIHEDDLDAADATWRNRIEGPDNDWAIRYRVCNAEKWPCFEERGSIVQRDEHGRAVLSRGTLADVSDEVNNEAERRELERRLEHGERLQSLGRLAGGVAHDFNNLLQVILGNMSFLPPDVGGLPEVRQIGDAAQRAAELTRQLLTFGRKVELQYESIDLNEVIVRLMSMLERVLPGNVEVDFIPAKHLGRVVGDFARLEQVFMNLCLNARDAMPQGGRLVIETEQVVINGAYVRKHPWAQPGRYILVSVSDTGVGMSSEVLNKVFEPFFSTKEVGYGTGLGLATAYAVVEEHGGMLHAYSEERIGSCFKVYLPVAERSADAVGPKIVPRVLGGRETVLIAEDDDAVRDLARRLLERAGYHVLTVSDGAAAVDLYEARQTDIDLVLLDAVMPAKDGRRVLEELRAKHPSVPILFMSGYSAATLDTAFLRKHGARLLSKPFDPDELLRAVRASLGDGDRSRARRPK